ncbi:O-acetyl-ADP-ribose deacetylase MACROD1-like isoform X2 [Zootermopsis nevadensis]|nr:O-acetyl-ADP-ribose deacetylase MACROD1-like isoform X2 [Zootermopsis nevadensis]
MPCFPKRLVFEAVPNHLTYTRHCSFLYTCYCQFSNMSRTGSPFEDEVLQKEKDKFLSMPLEEKRNLYKDSTYYTCDKIETWQDYFLKAKERLQKQFFDTSRNKGPGNFYSVDPELNKKVSLWQGNITHLEIDAIVNAANSRLRGGGGVDGAIHSAAGPSLKAECATLGGCDVGNAKITGGYCLPAKHVIHTVGPQGENSEKLESCYRTCLRVLVRKQLRSAAFPCISTGIYGYPQEAAAHVALKTVRNFLEENPSLIDRVIFCLFLKEDVKTYENLMQVYFPVENTKTNL